MSLIFIGAGNMAGALIGGLLASGRQATEIRAVDPYAPTRQRAAQRYGIAVAEQAGAFAADDVVVLAVKPQVMREVARGLADKLAGNLVISVAAGILMHDLGRWLGGHQRIIRVMPNTPSLIGQGVSGLVAGSGASEADLTTAETLLATVGQVTRLSSETQIDAVTAISGSGPAYVFRWMEAMMAAAADIGLDAQQARTLVLQTFKGAAELALASEDAPGTLRENVTSKGGTTAAALAVMDAEDIGGLIGRAVHAARDRSIELGRELGGD
ncbi:MAG: pyrroline-5-carboxylate reductase [Burkholderiaceae bacterium]